MTDKFSRLVRSIPSLYKPEVNVMIRGLLKSWGIEDDQIEIELKNTKDQLFVETASGRFLNSLGSNVGVDRDPGLGIEDPGFRQLIPVMSFFPKQVRATIISLLDVFWGPGFTRANVNSGNTETYNFGPTTLIGGTANFIKGERVIKGTGTQFTLELQPGDYIKPNLASGIQFSKISEIISDTELELSSPWNFNASINSDIEKGVTRTLEYEVDGRVSKVVRFTPNAFDDITNVKINELASFINSSVEHNALITASLFVDPVLGDKLNIRTTTPGIQGSIQIFGGDANSPARLNFPTIKSFETRVNVFEINANEVVVKIPSSVPILRRDLKGSAHPRQSKSEIFSSEEVFNFSSLGVSSTLELTIDSVPFVVNFNHSLDFDDPSKVTANEVAKVINNQLIGLESFVKSPLGFKTVGLRTTFGSMEYQITGGNSNTILNFTTTLQQDPDLIEENFPSSYLFDPVGQIFTVTSIKSNLSDTIPSGSINSFILLDDSSGFPNNPGKIILNFGLKGQEGPVNYNSRPNNASLLIDASFVFQKEHLVGSIVNFVDGTPTIPRIVGQDFPVFVVGTEEARESAQNLIKRLLAAGVVVRFEIDFPEFLFVCTCRNCGPSESPDFRGSLTD